MNISRRGFLKLLSSIPVAIVVDKAEATQVLAPIVRDIEALPEVKQDFFEGYFDFELRFDEGARIGVFDVSYANALPEVELAFGTPAYIPRPVSSTLSLSSVCGKSYPRFAKFLQTWRDGLYSGLGGNLPRKQAKLIKHTASESLVIADLDILFPRESQEYFQENEMYLDLKLEVSSVKIYKENLEKCQSTMV